MIGKIIQYTFDSFHNDRGGFSARKLSAFAAVMICVYVTLRFTTTENLTVLVTVWLVFALLCLGIVTAEQIIRFRNGEDNKTQQAQGTGQASGQGGA